VLGSFIFRIFQEHDESFHECTGYQRSGTLKDPFPSSFMPFGYGWFAGAALDI
jgi:hypothetical protein